MGHFKIVNEILILRLNGNKYNSYLLFKEIYIRKIYYKVFETFRNFKLKRTNFIGKLNLLNLHKLSSSSICNIQDISIRKHLTLSEKESLRMHFNNLHIFQLLSNKGQFIH